MNVSFQIIGHNIKAARKAARLTQEQAAERIGISMLHFGRIERGEREPSIQLLTRIADALNTSIYALLHDCILDPENYPAIFESPDPKTRDYGEYALLILDAYRAQIRQYYAHLRAKEDACS